MEKIYYNDVMSDPNQPVMVKTAANEFEASLMIARLHENEIEAYTEGGLTSGFRAEIPGGVRVMVRQADLERAQQIINISKSN